MGAPDLQTAAVDDPPRPRPRVPRTHEARERVDRRGRVEAELVDRELGRVRHLADLRLGDGVGDVGQRLHQEVGAELDEARARSSPAVSSGVIGVAARAYTGPVSSPSSSRITQTPVCASPASIARSTGAAPRQRGSSEKCTFTNPYRVASSSANGQQLPEGDHDAQIGLERAHLVRDLPGPLGRPHEQVELHRRGLDRTRCGLCAPAASTVGLGDHEHDVVAGRDDRPERGDRVVRRAAVDDAHGSRPFGMRPFGKQVRQSRRPVSLASGPAPTRAAPASSNCIRRISRRAALRWSGSSRSSISTPSR